MTTTSGKLNGQIALVTGGSRGIGAAIARRLAGEGATVALSYSASKDKAEAVVREIEQAGGKAAAFKADQADAAQVADLVKSVAAKYGRLDILVNNAGVFESGPVDQPVDAAVIARQYAINVVGVATAVRTAASLLADGGRVINVGSVLGERVPMPGITDYAATKFAVAGYTRGWARELAPRKITVNVVQPGPIDTDMNPADGENAAGFSAMIPLGRYGKAEEVAAAVAFFASPDASYITGSTLNVDGGFLA